MSEELNVQELIDARLAVILAPLDATIASQAAEIDDLEEQLANIEPHPVPTQWNTGVRGGLTSFPAGLGTAHDQTIENRSSSTTVGVPLSGANLTLANFKISSTGSYGLDVTAAAGFTAIDGQVNNSVKGAGVFVRCNFASLELTAASIVTDCYIPGGITGAGAAASTITNTTVVP